MSEPGFKAYLTAVAEVAALIGTHVFPKRIPQHDAQTASRVPCVVFQRVGGNFPAKTFCGSGQLVGASFQFDCYAITYDECKAVAGAVRRALVDYVGLMGGVNVQSVTLDTSFDAPTDFDPGLERESQTYTIWYIEDGS